uniref:STE20 related adaptor alpha n=1 Tax=Eptatretus burgeri TaxID=7764 RepID=A0A8C4NLD7_EPTBU
MSIMAFVLQRCSCLAVRSPREVLHDDDAQQVLTSSVDLRLKSTTMQMYQANPHHYQVLVEIGSGFEELVVVNLAKHLPSRSLVALRRVNLDSCSHEHLSLLQGELHTSQLFQHPNLLPYWATFIVEDELWAVTPLMDYGSARDLLSSRFPNGLPEGVIAHLLQETLRGLDYVHRMGYIHRAVRASHVLVCREGRVRLSGLRCCLPLEGSGRRGTVAHSFPAHAHLSLPWFSPELLRQNLQGYSTKSDIYSVGILACELANGHVPFKDMPMTQMLLEKLNGTVPCLLDVHTIPPEELDANDGLTSTHPYRRSFSTAFHDFTNLCFRNDPHRRPSAATLLNHQFFKQARRKLGEALLDLLAPAAPLADLAAAPPENHNGLDDVTARLEQLQTDDWDF